MNDLTILFYTANVIPEIILNPVLDDLRKLSFPIVSVSHKPMDLGKNIVVDFPRAVQSIYKQILVGAKEAQTEFVACYEDDCFYTEEHFKYRPEYHFGYNLNRWAFHLREGKFSYRRRVVMSQCIARRSSLIETLEERMTLKSIPDHLCGEPGRLENTLGLKPYPLETFETQYPNLVVDHKWGIFGRKKLGGTITDFVEGLGFAEEWTKRLS